jgi:hypothetical protein
MADQNEPTADDQVKAQQVAVAGAQAAAEGPAESAGDRAAAAMKQKRDEIQFAKMTDEDIDKLCDAFVTKLDERGAFEPPPEPPRAPPAAPAAPGEVSPAAMESGEPVPAAPQKRTWAHRFMGYR